MKESGLYNIKAIRSDLELQRKDGSDDLSAALFNIAQFQLWSNQAHSVAVSSLNEQ
jgi:hypothetical protein